MRIIAYSIWFTKTFPAILKAAKARGIKDGCFAKKKGLDELDMCRSHWVYKRLRNFRAGVESVISWLKRSLGFDRCNWKRPAAFTSYVWLSVVGASCSGQYPLI